MEDILGTAHIGVFIAITLVLMGFCAYMTGSAIANTWRPSWQIYVYIALLGAAGRFLVYALFDGELLAPTPYLFNTAILLTIALISHRLTLVHKMISQYPWRYERSDLFNWRERH